MQMQGNMYPQQMEWAMHQQLQQCIQGNRQTVANRAYHLEPLKPTQVQQQGGGIPGMMMGQPPGGGMMGGLLPYSAGPMIPQPADGVCATGYGAQGLCGNNTMGCSTALPGGVPNLQNDNGVFAAAGFAGKTFDVNNINFNGIFNSAANPQLQWSVATQDEGKPLPFPPGKILAQYPPEYQQQLIFYYRLLRLQYPDLYQQYVDYYTMYYEPLYNPPPPSVSRNAGEHKEPRKTAPPQPQRQVPQMPPRQPMMPPMQEMPQKEPEIPLEGIRRSTSNLNGGLKRQSSLRRQNSMRRNEVNQLKNEGGLQRLPSMRQQ
ncbi:hypothetical protein, unknown function [Leishmania tarentolae]|uniref:Uncharacterized protein n=1 Tax=Leishmania tarentolae TaxID=5689 RepID=A0A640KR01_LEITA|nr:hypothetical protein, unknown function [Leishmania tarentolae]